MQELSKDKNSVTLYEKANYTSVSFTNNGESIRISIDGWDLPNGFEDVEVIIEYLQEWLDGNHH